jgi:hypothetical protein
MALSYGLLLSVTQKARGWENPNLASLNGIAL